MSFPWPYRAEKVAARLALIEPYMHKRSQPLSPFRFLPLKAANVDAPIAADSSNWHVIAHDSYWGCADLHFVLKTAFTVPAGWDTNHLALHFPLGILGDIFNHPEALVHIDLEIVGSADRYHHTLPLAPDMADGQTHSVALHGWTGHASWPIDPNSKAKLFMGTTCLVERDPDLIDFVSLARAMLDTVSVLSDADPIRGNLLTALNEAITTLDTRLLGSARFYESVPLAKACLVAGKRSAGAPLDVTLHGVGHAHMDIAYLWTIDQIRLKNARTYSNVLRLMDQHPQFTFSHSQPQLYAMTAEDYPVLFERIRERVREGRWEVMGGMWVEADMNIPGPEALVRQFTLGRRFFRDHFGDVETPVLWLPDTFGFPGQTPQLMQQAGLKWFATNKLNWNQFNRVEPSTHHWEGIDGSRVISHVLTSPRPVQYLPFPTNYKSDLSAMEVLGTWTQSTAQDTVHDLPICYGYGDGGGGPTEELLAKAKAYEAMPGMPRLHASTVRNTFEQIEQSADNLAIWTGEHYMEGHRGVFTSQGWIKRANRKAEWALHEAEALSVMAGLRPDLTEAWQLLCLNQFHDIVTGTAITDVFVCAREDYKLLRAHAERASQAAGDVLSCADVSVANTSPVTGPRVALIHPAYPVAGQTVTGGTLAYFACLPAYSVTPVSMSVLPTHPVNARVLTSCVRLDNALVSVDVASNGQLTRVYDKTTEREVLADHMTGNQLQAFEDRPINWDAWDIDPDFEDRMDVIDGHGQMELIEAGPIRASVAITRRWRSSTLTQTIRLHAHSKRLDFETHIDWHETHTLLKAAFPTTVVTDTAEFDIQWGQVSRSTTRDTAFDAARFEVPAHKWGMIADAHQGVALLNDCKYGYDVRGSTLRLSLIKSATSPDPHADQGKHRFTYSLLPLTTSERNVLDQSAYDLNAPLRVLDATATATSQRSAGGFVQSSLPGVIIQTLKPADSGQGFILRLYEARHTTATTVLTFAGSIHWIARCDFQENVLEPVPFQGNRLRLSVSPFEIVSLHVVLVSHLHSLQGAI